MNELMVIENIKTITSLEVAKITKKDHKNILADIRDEISKLGEDRGRLIFQPIEYLDNRNRKQPMFNITSDGLLQLGARYDAVTRFNLIRKVRELQGIVKVPATMGEALEIALNLENKNRELQNKIEEDKPKLEFLDKVLESKGTFLTSEIAADYDISAIHLNRLLHEARLIRHVGGQWILYKKHMGKKYADSETVPYWDKAAGEERIKVQSRWTQRGRGKIHEILTGLGMGTVMDKEA